MSLEDNITTDGMNTDSENKTDERKQEKGSDYFYREFALGDFEVTFNFKKLKSPMDILEKFQQLHEDESMTNEEKNKIVQKIMNEYME